MIDPVRACDVWEDNGRLIEDVARLGYLRKDLVTLDSTWGRGVWWKYWRPTILVGHDIKIDGVDFRDLPYDDRAFEAVCFDPDYKLNGTPDPGTDERYGTDVAKRWQDRMKDMADGFVENARVLGYADGKVGGVMLAKCMDQVCSGSVRWQTDMFTELGERCGLTKIDRFDLLGGGRPQPEGRRQVTATYRPSTLLVFRKKKPRRRAL